MVGLEGKGQLVEGPRVNQQASPVEKTHRLRARTHIPEKKRTMPLAAVAVSFFLADATGWVPHEDSLGLLMHAEFIVIVSVAAIRLGFALRRRKGSTAAAPRINDASAYSSGDRLMHAIAFSGPGMHRTLACIDDMLCARSLTGTPDAPPIFITSLARGGTTALLKAIHD
jgi:hypothetical protein